MPYAMVLPMTLSVCGLDTAERSGGAWPYGSVKACAFLYLGVDVGPQPCLASLSATRVCGSACLFRTLLLFTFSHCLLHLGGMEVADELLSIVEFQVG